MSESAGATMQGRVVVVTGAATGLGLSTAEVLARRGAAVTLVDLNAERVTAEARRLADEGTAAEAQAVDLTDQGQVGDLIDGVVDRHGRIDGLVNLAALYQSC